MCMDGLNHLAVILVGRVLWHWVRRRADGRAAVDIPVVAIDDDLGGIANQEEVPVDKCDKDTAADDVAESCRDHALPDVVAHADVWVMQENLSFLVSSSSKGRGEKIENLRPRECKTYWPPRGPNRAIRRRTQATR